MMNKALRNFLLISLIAIALVSALLALYRVDLIAAFVPGGISTTSRIVYALIGVAALIVAVFIAAGDSAPIPGIMGRSSGDNRGPAPGDGAVIHHSSGEADFGGAAGDTLPPVKGGERDLPYPSDRNAD